MDPITFFADEPWTAGVIGLGYVGLPLAVTAAERGLTVVGYDVAPQVIEDLEAGISHIDDVNTQRLAAAVASGLRFTNEPKDLAEADAIFIAVPSPLTRAREPDMSYIEAAAATVAAVVRPGQLVSLESTTYPGTTDDVILPAATRSGLVLDEQVFVAFSPERVSPGEGHSLASIPKVVGGVTERSGRVAAAAYGRIVDVVHPVSSARAAEMTKLLENTYRAVNISFVNEVAQLAHAMGIDIWEVIEAADTKPFGYQAFWPGPGVGGHCIPLDPMYLKWSAEQRGAKAHFIHLADQVNRDMPAYTAQRVLDLLDSRGVAADSSVVLAVGVAFKPDVSDDRESPALDVLRHLTAAGATIHVLDPLVSDERIRAHGYGPVTDASGPYDVAVVLTDHRVVDLDALAASVPVVFDARGAYRRRGSSAQNVVPL